MLDFLAAVIYWVCIPVSVVALIAALGRGRLGRGVDRLLGGGQRLGGEGDAKLALYPTEPRRVRQLPADKREEQLA